MLEVANAIPFHEQEQASVARWVRTLLPAVKRLNDALDSLDKLTVLVADYDRDDPTRTRRVSALLRPSPMSPDDGADPVIAVGAAMPDFQKRVSRALRYLTVNLAKGYLRYAPLDSRDRTKAALQARRAVLFNLGKSATEIAREEIPNGTTVEIKKRGHVIEEALRRSRRPRTESR